MTTPNDPKAPTVEQKWGFAKIGCALMILAFVFMITGTFIAMEYAYKFNALNKPSRILMFVGTGLVAWNVYRVIFPKR
jgi:hypothetical protein